MANDAKSYIGFNDSGIVNLDDNNTGAQMLDKFTRLKDGRRIQPLDQYDNVIYPHRYMYDNYNLLIGDTYFMIPPEFIMVNSEAPAQSIVTLRQENTQKMKSGYHKRTILIDIVFNGTEQLNGYPVEGPEGMYYVDGLRQLLAQFKCTPFLPVTNELINSMYGIFTVALQSINMRTVPGFPGMMIAQITLQEVNMFPYIQMPDAAFRYMIDWDLFRYYYQRFLTETHEYKKLQSLPANKEHNRFKISILDESVFSSEKANKYNMLEIICDKEIVKTLEDGSLDTTNYTEWLNSDTDNVFISSFQCGYQNLLTNIQLSDSGAPTVQFMGGMDTIYNITFETTDYSVVQSLEQCQITNDTLTRGNRKLSSLGFVKLESELVEFTGSLFVMIETIATNTIPGFPGLYNVQIQCVAYDIAQSEREELHGFMPFECDKKGKCGEYDKDADDGNGGKGAYMSDHVHDEQAIEQSMNGLLIKIKQDAYAEWKLRTSIEVYPDLRLPTYDEVDAAITKIRKFREKKSLTQLSYDKYPKTPTCMLHGLNPDNNISFDYESSSYKNDCIIDITSIDSSDNEYNVFVDPDFYVFYPTSYLSFLQEDEECYNTYSPKTRTGYTKTKKVERTPYSSVSGSGNSALIEEFISTAKSFIGHTYVYGTAGEKKDAVGEVFDCSGFVTYLLKKIGVMPSDKGRFSVSSMPGDDLFIEVSESEIQKGDIICNKELDHVIIYEGNDTVIHASNSSPYPKGGVKETVFSKYKNSSSKPFIVGPCLRPKAFIQSDNQNINISNSGDVASQVWTILKSYGLSNVAIAGILGNMQAESGVNPGNLEGEYNKYLGYTDQQYTEAVDNGSYSKERFISDHKKDKCGAGYGLVQFTWYTQKAALYDKAKAEGKSISDISVQISVLMGIIKQSGVFDKLNKAQSIKEASTIFLLEYERPKDQSTKVQNKRAEYAQTFYDKYNGTSNSNTFSSMENIKNAITRAEFESICRIVMAETQGEPVETEKAVAQVIYDRLTHPTKKFGGLGNILNSTDQFKPPYQGELNSTVENNVKAVFCENNKCWPTYKAWYFLISESNKATFRDREDNYDRLGEIGRHIFWGEETEGSDIKYVIIDTIQGTGTASQNKFSYDENIFHEAVTIEAVEKFGQPVLIRSEGVMYDDNWTPWGNDEGEVATKELNSIENTFNTAFCDEVQYSGRGRLLRAFPTYLFCILDDQCQWYDGRKLWTNYYVHKSVVDIAVHGTNDMPTETATIVITNSYHNLDRTQGGLSSYSIENDEGYNGLQRWFYSWTGMLLGFGPKLTDKLIKLHQVIYDHAMLREGARVHLRMGYGSDPLSLAPVMNGHISDVSLGDQISIVVTSDGHEFIQDITSANENDTNNGWFGLFGLGEDQESSNIIAGLLCARQSWFTHLMGQTFEGSKYSMEHFGLFFNETVMRWIANYVLDGFVETTETAIEGAEAGSEVGRAAGEALGGGIPVISSITEFAGQGVGAILGATSGTVVGTVDGVFQFAEGIKNAIGDIWNGHQEQYDLLKNIYKANYKRQHYIYTTALFGMDGEQNVVFNKYNMTPWDVCQICTQQVPEYILKTTYHQFDSRLYFGLPSWVEKYRYDYLNGQVFEECKTAAQVHFLDSMDCIIDNQVKVTSKFSNTNIKAIYTRGESPVSTQTIHSDDSIDFAKQKTTILDTPICQDALGPDMIYEFLGYKIGEESARRVGISNLLYGWQQQYQGQILLMGHPGLKPHDFIMINDSFANLYGLALVREVTHSFNTNTGFTTSIVPGMIGFSTDENSGMIETTKNYLMLLNCFSSYTQLRKVLRNNYEKNISVIADMELMKNRLASRVQFQKTVNIVGGVVDVGMDLGSIALTINAGRSIFQFTKNLYNMAKTGKIVKTFMTTYKAVKGAAKGIQITLTAIKAGTIATGTAAGGIPGLVIAAIWIIVDILISEIIDWFSNRNVCVLLPLWWEGYPFVAGVKDGEKILLMGSNANSTDENTKQSRVDNKNRTDTEGN